MTLTANCKKYVVEAAENPSRLSRWMWNRQEIPPRSSAACQ